MVNDDRRLTRRRRDAIVAKESELFVSAVVACEYTDLQIRNRLPVDESISELVTRFDIEIAPFPAEAWAALRGLPRVHQDPVDRMLIAHALVDGSTLVTADANIRRYPVACI